MAKINKSFLTQQADQFTEQKTYELFERTIGLAPVKTGFLKQNILMERAGTAKYIVESAAPYTEAVIFGHLARGQEAGDTALQEKIADATGEASGVTKVPANPFMQEAIDSMAE